jgi:hypothetical protein
MPPSSSASKWLADHWDDLPEDTWVAANSLEKKAEASSYDELIQLLENQQVDLSEVAIVFVPPSQDIVQ